MEYGGWTLVNFVILETHIHKHIPGWMRQYNISPPVQRLNALEPISLWHVESAGYCTERSHVLCVFLHVSATEKGAYDHIVVNDDLEVAYEKLKGILIKVRSSRSL